MSNQKVLGQIFEFYTQQYLKAKQFQIIHTNYRGIFAEIDLICTHRQTLYFIEVKFRSHENFQDTLELYLKSQYAKLLKEIHCFRRQNPNYKTQQIQIEIFLYSQQPEKKLKLRCFKLS